MISLEIGLYVCARARLCADNLVWVKYSRDYTEYLYFDCFRICWWSTNNHGLLFMPKHTNRQSVCHCRPLFLWCQFGPWYNIAPCDWTQWIGINRMMSQRKPKIPWKCSNEKYYREKWFLISMKGMSESHAMNEHMKSACERTDGIDENKCEQNVCGMTLKEKW